MKEKFLLYLIYISLIEIRERSYEINEKKIYWLCDLLHNVPLSISSNEIDEAYKELQENVKELHIDAWLELRRKEFYQRYPEYENQLN